MMLFTQNKKGQVNLIVIVLAVVFVVAVASLTFTWVKKTTFDESEKGTDKVTAQDICNDDVKNSLIVKCP